MSHAPAQYLPPVYRHPLGLPQGSIRALLALMIVGQFCLFMLMPGDPPPVLPLYMHLLLVLVMVYFVARGKEPSAAQQAGPLHLPRFFIRAVVILALGAAVGWRWYSDGGPQSLLDRLTPVQSQWQSWPYLLVTLGGCFVLGRLLRLGPWRNAAWFQDFLAWVSLLAMIALFAELLLTLFIDPNLTSGLNRTVWECVLVGIPAAYVSVRS